MLLVHLLSFTPFTDFMMTNPIVGFTTIYFFIEFFKKFMLRSIFMLSVILIVASGVSLFNQQPTLFLRIFIHNTALISFLYFNITFVNNHNDFGYKNFFVFFFLIYFLNLLFLHLDLFYSLEIFSQPFYHFLVITFLFIQLFLKVKKL